MASAHKKTPFQGFFLWVCARVLMLITNLLFLNFLNLLLLEVSLAK